MTKKNETFSAPMLVLDPNDNQLKVKKVKKEEKDKK